MPTTMRVAVGSALATVGAVVWAFAVAYLTPGARRGEQRSELPDGSFRGPTPDELVNWVNDLRWAAVVLAVCGAALAVGPLARRAGTAATLSAVGLLTADAVLGRLSDPGWRRPGQIPGTSSIVEIPASSAPTEFVPPYFSGLWAFAATFAAASAVVVGAHVAARHVRIEGLPWAPARASWLVIPAAAAAVTATAVSVGARRAEDTQFLPGGMGVAVALVQLGLVLAAVACALAVRDRLTRPVVTAAAVAVGVAGPLVFVAGLVSVRSEGAGAAAALMAPLAMTAAGIASPRRRTWQRWLGLIGLTVLAVPALLVVLVVTVPVGITLLYVTGTDGGVDSTWPVAPQAALAGLAVGCVAWARTPRRGSTALSEPAREHCPAAAH